MPAVRLNCNLDTRPLRLVALAERPWPSTQEPTRGMMFDQFSNNGAGGVHGWGVALLPTFSAEPLFA